MDSTRALTIGLAYQMGLIRLTDDELEIVRANLAREAQKALLANARDCLARARLELGDDPTDDWASQCGAQAVLRAVDHVRSAGSKERVVPDYRSIIGTPKDRSVPKFSWEREEPRDEYGNFGPDQGPKARAGLVAVHDVSSEIQQFARMATAAEGAAS